MVHASPKQERPAHSHDVLLVGGGLQNGLIALAGLALRPHLRLALIERASSLGGNHTWCHTGELPDGTASFIGPLITHRYEAYDVSVPGFAQTVR